MELLLVFRGSMDTEYCFQIYCLSNKFQNITMVFEFKATKRFIKIKGSFSFLSWTESGPSLSLSLLCRSPVRPSPPSLPVVFLRSASCSVASWPPSMPARRCPPPSLPFRGDKAAPPSVLLSPSYFSLRRELTLPLIFSSARARNRRHSRRWPPPILAFPRPTDGAIDSAVSPASSQPKETSGEALNRRHRCHLHRSR
jgi:hypothetical protein